MGVFVSKSRNEVVVWLCRRLRVSGRDVSCAIFPAVASNIPSATLHLIGSVPYPNAWLTRPIRNVGRIAGHSQRTLQVHIPVPVVASFDSLQVFHGLLVIFLFEFETDESATLFDGDDARGSNPSKWIEYDFSWFGIHSNASSDLFQVHRTYVFHVVFALRASNIQRIALAYSSPDTARPFDPFVSRWAGFIVDFRLRIARFFEDEDKVA